MVRSSLGTAIGVGVLIAAVSGCAWNRHQTNQADMVKRSAEVVPGQTTAAELEEIAGGPPTSITPVGDKEAYVYTFGDAKTEALNLILIVISKTNSAIDTAVFLVDENNVVESMKVGNNTEDLPWEWWSFGD